MCTGSQKKDCAGDLNRESMASSSSILLELAADDDLLGFKVSVEEEKEGGGSNNIDKSGIWYGRKIGSNQMGIEERTPLMIASMFGSKQIVEYILQHDGINVNRVCGSDGATALHCAVTGGSSASYDVVSLLLDASADINSVDANGKRPVDLLSPVRSPCSNARKNIPAHMLTRGCGLEESFELNDDQLIISREGIEKKEYPIDPSLPDIRAGMYGSDEFRMYTFKVKPCSRAYSHDWTECPFVHPGENARRRDPRKYHYSCVPCPDFRKGSCHLGDICENAHGIFESWLHPAQYRTRLCKEETNCSRRVCFFAHKPDELRLLYASSGSAAPSPRSFASSTPSALDLSSISPLSLGLPPISTPPLTPSGGSSMWGNLSPVVSTTLQFPGRRLKSTRNTRDIHLDADQLIGLPRHQEFLDDFNCLSSPSSWSSGLTTAATFSGSSFDRESEGIWHSGMNPSSLEDRLHGLSINDGPTQLLSPKGLQLRQNINMQLPPSYTSSHSSSPLRTPSSLNSDTRSAAFVKRSQSFIERGVVSSTTDSPISGSPMPYPLSDWSSPTGKLDWGIQKEDINKLRKSASFGFRKSGNNIVAMPRAADETDVSWSQALVTNVSAPKLSQVDFEQHRLNGVESETQASWADLFYLEHEKIVA